jgi:hypothetical protein
VTVVVVVMIVHEGFTYDSLATKPDCIRPAVFSLPCSVLSNNFNEKRGWQSRPFP